MPGDAPKDAVADGSGLNDHDDGRTSTSDALHLPLCTLKEYDRSRNTHHETGVR